MPLQIILAPDGTFTIGGLEPKVLDILLGGLANACTDSNPVLKAVLFQMAKLANQDPEVTKALCDSCEQQGNPRQVAELFILSVPFISEISKGSVKTPTPVNPDEQAG